MACALVVDVERLHPWGQTRVCLSMRAFAVFQAEENKNVMCGL
jgi:hypothetical protein